MYNTGDKFIIEIEQEFRPGKYAIRGAQSLFLEEDFDHLTPIEEDELYQRGLKDAWEAARKLECDEEDGGLSMSAIEEIFGTRHLGDIFTNVPADEAVEGIREYEEKLRLMKRIHVGDEIKVAGELCVITGFEGGIERYVGASGKTYANYVGAEIKKTGRHFPQIAEVLKQMQEATDEQT